MKRVAVYYPWIHLRGGAERAVLEIVRRSRHRCTVFTNHLDLEQTYPEFRHYGNVRVLKRVPVERSFGKVIAAAATILLQKLDLREFDVLLVSSEGLGDLITFRNAEKPIVCHCHTPVRPVYDSVYRRTWLDRHPGSRMPLTAFSLLYSVVTRMAWRHYRRVFVNSREVAARIAAGRICPADKVEVVHSGVAHERVHATFTYRPFFLYAGRIKWTKNVRLAIEAFQEFEKLADAVSGEWRLVVAGSVDRGSSQYYTELRQRVHGDARVEFRLNPSEDELGALYDQCAALVYPSLNEDWGLVPLEAMAYGKPVLAVNRGGPTESIVAGETGFLLEPSAAAFAAKMTWLVEHPEEARRMGVAAAARAKEYSWDAFVQRLDDYIEQHC